MPPFLELRDVLAGFALMGLLTTSKYFTCSARACDEELAMRAYRLADSMLKARLG